MPELHGPEPGVEPAADRDSQVAGVARRRYARDESATDRRSGGDSLGPVFTGIVWWLFGDDQLLLSIGLVLAVLNIVGIHFVLAWVFENQEEFAG